MAFSPKNPGDAHQRQPCATASEEGFGKRLGRSAPRRLLAAAILALVCHATVQAAQVSWRSDGSDGVFAPLNSLVIRPGPDGTFNFTSVDIPRDVVVSVERDSNGGEVYLLATGDISIRGALDSGIGKLHLYTPGTVSIQGKIYGESIHVGYGQLHLVDNPNGNPDEHRNNAGSVIITADGPLPIVPGTSIETVDATTLSGAVLTAAIIAPDLEVLSIAPTPAHNFQLSQPGASMTLQADDVTLVARAPVPGALPLLASALLGLAGLGFSRRKR